AATSSVRTRFGVTGGAMSVAGAGRTAVAARGKVPTRGGVTFWATSPAPSPRRAPSGGLSPFTLRAIFQHGRPPSRRPSAPDPGGSRGRVRGTVPHSRYERSSRVDRGHVEAG